MVHEEIPRGVFHQLRWERHVGVCHWRCLWRSVDRWTLVTYGAKLVGLDGWNDHHSRDKWWKDYDHLDGLDCQIPGPILSDNDTTTVVAYEYSSIYIYIYLCTHYSYRLQQTQRKGAQIFSSSCHFQGPGLRIRTLYPNGWKLLWGCGRRPVLVVVTHGTKCLFIVTQKMEETPRD